MVPIVFQQFVRKFAARPNVVVFFHMRPLPIPSVPESERYVLSRTTIPSCYRLTIRHGYADIIVKPDLARAVMDQLVLYVTRAESSSPELDVIEKAFAAQTTYIMGKEQMKVRPGSFILRKILLKLFFFIRENLRTKMANLGLPIDNLVEVGFLKEI